MLALCGKDIWHISQAGYVWKVHVSVVVFCVYVGGRGLEDWKRKESWHKWRGSASPQHRHYTSLEETKDISFIVPVLCYCLPRARPNFPPLDNNEFSLKT